MSFLDEEEPMSNRDTDQDEPPVSTGLPDGLAVPEACGEPEADKQVDDPGRSSALERLQKITRHPAFKPIFSFVVGGIGLGIEILRESSSSESDEPMEKEDEPFDALDQEERECRKSPVEHRVRPYDRTQRYGFGNAETKTIHVEEYVRGGGG